EGRGPQADQPWQGRGFGRGDRGQGGPAMSPRDERGPRFGAQAQGREQDPNGVGFGRGLGPRGFLRELNLTDEQIAKLRDMLK
ncbi:MAG: hypothetical protein JXR73_10815, partial [Candidatus Omnitrophica bacterium]|nr:hypothetical protein [Candidatus Omnitrophota bacterium]